MTLTATSGYTLTGITPNYFTVSGATATNSADTGVVSAVFPATANAVINTAAIAGVTAPVAGATPVTSVSGTGYTGAVTWSPSVSGTFAYGTAYTATVTLTAASGYTLTGVTQNFFTVAGTSPTATNSAGSGVVTAAFSTTTALPTGFIYTSSISGGLIWAPNTSMAKWITAKSTCENLSVSGITGNAKPSTDIFNPTTTWRQPTRNELVDLFAVRNSGITPAGWSPTGWTLDFTWSSTVAVDGRYVVDLSNGDAYPYPITRGDSTVSCVH